MRTKLPGLRRTPVLLAAALLATTGAAVATMSAAAAADCTDVEVVVARGTGESGQLGRVVGDPVFAAIDRRLPGATVSSHAVDYPASLSLSSAAQGNRALVDHVTAQARACPDQQFVLVGYSQGANVVGNSLGVSSRGAAVGSRVVATVPDSVEPQIAAVLLFGSPLGKLGRGIDNGFADRTLDLCAPRDIICDPRGASWAAHLRYTRNAGEAADFAVARL